MVGVDMMISKRADDGPVRAEARGRRRSKETPCLNGSATRTFVIIIRIQVCLSNHLKHQYGTDYVRAFGLGLAMCSFHVSPPPGTVL
jgi:hypothetical protein